MTHLTNLVEFPALGLSFPLNRVAFSIGGINIYWYGVCIAVGMCLALVFAFRHGVEFGVDADAMVDVILIGVVMGILCARLYYVAMAPYNYDSLWEVLAIRDGGLAIYGGILAAFLTAWLVCRKKKIGFWALADCCVAGFFIGQAIGRWGNFFNREAFGGMTELPWRMRLWISGTYYIDVHPTFLYESLWNVAGLLLLCLAVDKVRRFDGENTCFYFLWYGIGRFWIEGLRTDSLYLFNLTLFGERVRVSQALSLVMIVLTAVILLKNRSADPARMFVNRRLDGQATVLPDRSEERPIADSPAEGAAEPADGGDNG